MSLSPDPRALEWRAERISPTAPSTPAGTRPAYRLRGELVVDRPVRRAVLHSTAHGIYELELDGARVTADELTPGFTEYASRTQVQAYDVTEALTPGPHTLDALLADGWYRGQVGILRAADQWGDTTAFLAQLHLEHDDGPTTIVCTDDTWLAVLDVLEDERALPRVATTGETLREAVRDATRDVSCVGDVRGMGLANGIEIVSPTASKTPDPVIASDLKNAVKRNGVLIGTTGAAANVLKVRPPLAFTEREVPVFVDALVASLRGLNLPR